MCMGGSKGDGGAAAISEANRRAAEAEKRALEAEVEKERASLEQDELEQKRKVARQEDIKKQRQDRLRKFGLAGVVDDDDDDLGNSPTLLGVNTSTKA